MISDQSYLPLLDTDPILAEPVELLQPARPRVWTVFVFVVAAVVASFFVSLLVAFVALRYQFGNLTRDQLTQPQLLEFAESRVGFLVAILPNQLSILILTLLACLFSTQPIRDRLSLRAGRLPIWSWGLMILATPMVGFLTSIILSTFTTDRGPNMESMLRLFRAQSGVFFLVVAVLVGVLPGVCEEILFRGYMQTRLLARFPVWLAIGLSALFFSVAHLDPLHAIGVFPLGVWLGIVAWRCGTIWPATLAHAFNNTLAVIMTRIDIPRDANDNPLNSPQAIMAILVALAIFAISGTSFVAACTFLIVKALQGKVRDEAANETGRELEPFTALVTQTSSANAPMDSTAFSHSSSSSL